MARLERVHASEHLVEDEAEGVPIDRVAVLFVTDDLRGQILRRTTERLGAAVSILKARFRETEVSKADMPLIIDQNILRLQVTIDHP